MEVVVAFEVRFPAGGAPMADDVLVGRLLERGEPARIVEDGVALKALPVAFFHADGTLCARVRVTAVCPLTRLVDMLFDLSMQAGADVELVGRGEVTRPVLWLMLADEQDRVRLAEALDRAREHSNCMEVMRRLWSVINSLRPGRDDRWDATRERIVEVREVGGLDGLALSVARKVEPDAAVGDEVSVPVEGQLHTLAWRWLSEAYPGLAESQHTLH